VTSRAKGPVKAAGSSLIPITPKLISMNRATHKRESVPAELLAAPAEYRIGNNDVCTSRFGITRN
jgi:polysaccharide export outer membrane protein